MDLVNPQIPSDICVSGSKGTGCVVDYLKSDSSSAATLCLPLSSAKSESSQSPRYAGLPFCIFQNTLPINRLLDSPNLSASHHYQLSTPNSLTAPASPVTPSLNGLKRPSFTLVTCPDFPDTDSPQIKRNKDHLRSLLDSDRLRVLKNSLPSRASRRSLCQQPPKESISKRITKCGIAKRLSWYWDGHHSHSPIIFKRLGIESQSLANSHAHVNAPVSLKQCGSDSEFSREVPSDTSFDFAD